ncbi:MAG: DNA topoisomerase III, partial [Eubacteriales bacterium]
KGLMHRKDINEIVIATDAGREGELVGRWIIDKSHISKPIKRLWISSVTDKAIRQGFDNIGNGEAYENLYKSAVARSEADWVVGINATRALTCKYNAQLSCGRVQTPTLSMIAKKEEDIKNFKPKTYYEIQGMSKGLRFIWQDSKSKNTRIFNKKEADQILDKLKGKKGEVISVDKKDIKVFSPKLYDLTELQREANKRFDFSAKETLSIMQTLYERHKILTYPRTDSRYISTDIVDTLKERLKACGVGTFAKLTAKLIRGNIKANKNYVNNSKVSDHHAIIPTEESVILNQLSNSERKIYDLVVKRFIAVLSPPFEYQETVITVKVDQETFVTKGKKVISLGWKAVYEDNDNKDEYNMITDIKKGEFLKIDNLCQITSETKPPAPFNEGTLLSAMENPTKYLETNDKKIVKTLDEAGGIGTVATRADIIEKLFNTFLIEKKDKDIFITSKGKQLLELVPEEMKSPELTAEWELKLSKIAKGELNKEQFITQMKSYAKDIVNEIKNSEEKFKHDNLTGNKCPECGKFMLEVNGKRGKLLVCQDRECGYRKNIAKKTKARCPNCKRVGMELRGSGDGQIFVCKCGYREKLSSFEKRKDKDKAKASKRDTIQYMKKQRKEEKAPVNTPFAEALAKLKVDK